MSKVIVEVKLNKLPKKVIKEMINVTGVDLDFFDKKGKFKSKKCKRMYKKNKKIQIIFDYSSWTREQEKAILYIANKRKLEPN